MGGISDGPAGTSGVIEFGSDGSIVTGDGFRRAEACWYAGIAAMGRCGTGLIIGESFLGGRSSQQRVASALADLPVVWVGVRCDPEAAAAREHGRPDRVEGMARLIGSYPPCRSGRRQGRLFHVVKVQDRHRHLYCRFRSQGSCGQALLAAGSV